MIRRVLVTLALATGIAVVPMTPAHAQKYCGVHAECGYYFFLEPEKIHLVGQYLVLCGGSIYQWGTQTSYQIYDEQPC
jgi:hypothetical protein